VLAGIFAGCLVIKPQYGILLPICFLAARNYRGFAAATATGMVLCVASYGAFGMQTWQHFFVVELGTEHLRLDLPWPQPFQNIMITPFIMLRSLGASLALANITQAMVTLCAAVAAWVLWSRPQAGALPFARVAVTLCLGALATPFGYLYDLPSLGLAVFACAAAARWERLLPLAVFMLFTAFYIILSVKFFVAGPLLLAALVVLLWRDAAMPRRIAAMSSV
jgi:hypothetical protein